MGRIFMAFHSGEREETSKTEKEELITIHFDIIIIR